MKTKLLTTACAALLLSGTAALAGDPVMIDPVLTPPPPPAPAPAPSFNWSGAYIGIQGGYSWGNSTWTLVDADGSAVVDFGVGDTQTWGIAGPSAGIFGGYNFDAGGLVFGIEGSANLARINGTDTSIFNEADDVMTTEVSTLYTLVGRVGVAMDNVLLYAMGGYAGGRIDASFTDDTGANQGDWAGSAFHHGWTAGAGVDFALSDNMVLGVQFAHTRLRPTTHVGTETPSGLNPAYDISASFNTISARASFLFH